MIAVNILFFDKNDTLICACPAVFQDRTNATPIEFTMGDQIPEKAVGYIEGLALFECAIEVVEGTKKGEQVYFHVGCFDLGARE